MKKLLQNTLFVVCFLLLYIGANAQLVMVTPTNSSTNCNGSAAIDSTQFINNSPADLKSIVGVLADPSKLKSFIVLIL